MNSKTLILIILSSFMVVNITYGKKTILENGIYLDESQLYIIEINNNVLSIWNSTEMMGGKTNVPLTVCSITHYKDNIYMLFTIDGSYYTAFRGMQEERCPMDSSQLIPHITFKTPNLSSPIEFILNRGNNRGITQDNICTLDIPEIYKKNNYDISFSFRPLEYPASDVANQYFGLLYYTPWLYNIPYSDENIIITLPNLTDDVFEQYYFYNDLIYIDGNFIKFKHFDYKKTKFKSVLELQEYLEDIRWN